jgi:hypothetical protein
VLPALSCSDDDSRLVGFHRLSTHASHISLTYLTHISPSYVG